MTWAVRSRSLPLTQAGPEQLYRRVTTLRRRQELELVRERRASFSTEARIDKHATAEDRKTADQLLAYREGIDDSMLHARRALLPDGLARTEGVAAQLWSSERHPAVEPPPENLIVKVFLVLLATNVARIRTDCLPLNPTKCCL